MESENTDACVALNRHIVVFLDLLGFRAKMAAIAQDSGRASALLTEYDAVMRAAFDLLDNGFGMFKYKGFTDNVVISSPLAAGYHPEERFGIVIGKVAEFQMMLARAGWFIRGGIAIGDFYMDERIVFGPALVEAYLLEQHTALFPRVVLSGEAKNWMRSFVEFYSDKRTSPQNTDVLIDIDGHAFINYLAARYLSEARELTLDDLEAHKLQVEGALAANRNDVSIWTKYRWSAQYHDHFAGAMSYDEGDGGPLLISKASLHESPRDLCDEVLPKNFPIPWEGSSIRSI